MIHTVKRPENKPTELNYKEAARRIKYDGKIACYRTEHFHAILIRDGGSFGFRYANKLAANADLHFEGSTIENALDNARKAGRLIHILDSVAELEHVTK